MRSTPRSFPTDDPPLLEADLPPASDQPESAAPALDTTAQIDVLVVWTPAARAAVGSTTAMQNLVTLAVANANTAYANSQIAAQLRLVYSGEIAFAEASTNISGDLGKLATSGDGALDTVQTLRDQDGADVVSLIGTGYTSGSGACGIGYLMTTVSTTFASAAFNVVDQACAAGNLSLAHEIGHNEGLHHDPANASGQGAYPYAFGYQDPGGAVPHGHVGTGMSTRIRTLESQRLLRRKTHRRCQHPRQRSCAQQHGGNGRDFPDSRRAHVQLHGHTALAATRGRGWSLDSDRHHGPRLCMDSHESRGLDHDGHRGRHRNGLVYRQRRRERTVRALGTLTVAGRSVTVSQTALACSYTSPHRPRSSLRVAARRHHRHHPIVRVRMDHERQRDVADDIDRFVIGIRHRDVHRGGQHGPAAQRHRHHRGPHGHAGSAGTAGTAVAAARVAVRASIASKSPRVEGSAGSKKRGPQGSRP